MDTIGDLGTGKHFSSSKKMILQIGLTDAPKDGALDCIHNEIIPLVPGPMAYRWRAFSGNGLLERFQSCPRCEQTYVYETW